MTDPIRSEMTELDRDPLEEPADHPLMGRRVRVVLDRDDSRAVMVGRLVAVTASGDVTVDTDTGRRYGWPTLDITEADRNREGDVMTDTSKTQTGACEDGAGGAP